MSTIRNHISADDRALSMHESHDLAPRMTHFLDIQKLQEFLDSFYAFTGWTLGIVDFHGEILAMAGKRTACRDIHRAQEAMTSVCSRSIGKMALDADRKFTFHTCLSGLTLALRPLTIKGRRFATFFTGHFFSEKPDLEKFRLQARVLGCDEDEFLQAVGEVPVFSKQEIRRHLDFLSTLADTMTDLANEIWQRRRARQAFTESERKYRHLTEHTADIIWTTDLNFRFTYVSPSVEKIKGFTVEEMLDLTIDRVLTAESIETMLPLLYHHIELENTPGARPDRNQTMELQEFCKDGRILWTEANVCFLRDSEGKATGLMGITREISERKMEQQEKAAALERIRCQQAALAKLSKLDHQTGDFRHPAREITRMAADAMNVSRVSIWLGSPARGSIECITLLDTLEGSFSEDSILYTHEFPRYFEALSKDRAIVAHKAREDEQTSEFTDAYLVPLGITSMLDAPVRISGKLAGVVCFEHRGEPRQWLDDEIRFAGEIADQAAQAFLNAERARERKRLEKINTCLLQQGADFNDNIQELTALCGELLGGRCALYCRVDAKGFSAPGKWNVPGDIQGMEKPEGHIWFTMLKSRIPGLVTFRDLTATDYAKTDTVVSRSGVKSFLGHTVKCNESTVGALCIYFAPPLSTGEDDNHLLEIVAAAIGAEERRREAVEALRNSERNYRELYESMMDAYCMVDMEGHIVESNRSYRNLVGYNEEEMKNLTYSSITPEKWHTAEMQIVREQILKRGYSDIYEKEYRTKDGTIVPVELRTSLITGDSGTPVGMWAIVRDITERKLASEELMRARDAAEAANSAKSEFLANMSHEFRTPMNGIITMTDLTLTSGVTDEQREYLTLLRRSSENLLKIINNVLDLSMIEAGKMALLPGTFSLRTVLSETLLALKSQADIKSIALSYHVDESIPDLLGGDSLRLSQVIGNLAGNAIKFTEKGSISISADLQATEGTSVKLLFTIVDTGCGISEETMMIIFDAFVQGDSSTRKLYDGAGLGLSICRELVHLMGGTLEVESVPGEGSSFRFTADFDVMEAPVKNKMRAGSGRKESNRIPPLSILVCEDDAISRLAILQFLKREGHAVKQAKNGKQALEILSKEQFQVILMDIQMPGMDGLEATRAIRKLEEGIGKRAYIAALTAYAMKKNDTRFQEAGMDDYISKPMDYNELRELLERVTTRLSFSQ